MSYWYAQHSSLPGPGLAPLGDSRWQQLWGPAMRQASAQLSPYTTPHENVTKWVEFLEPCLQTGKQRPQEVVRQLQCVEQAGDRLRSLRRLFWLKEEQKGFGATRVSMGYT